LLQNIAAMLVLQNLPSESSGVFPKNALLNGVRVEFVVFEAIDDFRENFISDVWACKESCVRNAVWA
jgi:hypothetical protein